MIRLSANLSKKIPVAGVQFSSQQYGASLEIEVSDADKPDAIQARIRELYTLLSLSIDEQIGAVKPAAPVQQQNGNGHVQAPPPPASQPVPQQRNGYATRNRVAAANGSGRNINATQAQQRAIFAIAKSLNLDLPSLLADYNCADVSQLPIRDASTLIDFLKTRQNGNGAAAQ